ncbi:DNA polymerase III subunit delta' [Ligilactobacillus salitolerans]|uniref:DNA polymerase III subunit delta n=1 Tax=Ligilactobacillus salitolerans TaxID=1808352 RepID=A0A401IVK7_9LACO|nr:DNA polymerase III subunit delta' [Ligilactobacillus salitolerans]GBG95517.1 DNA polymerase III subunit delta' [Ligilactobacillus salitolerans]
MEITDAQPQLTEHFLKLACAEQLAHAYLLVGDQGAGKKELALWVAQLLFCTEVTAAGPCGHCSECSRILAHEHPDVVEVAPTGLSIKIDQIRYLKSEFAKSGVEGAQKVFIIEDAEKMSSSAANGLLKFLEEPSGEVVAFLLSSEQNKILPTIISRCQLIELQAPSSELLAQQLEKKGIQHEQAVLAAHVTKSSQKAEELLADDNYQAIISNLWQWYSAILKNDLRAFVDVQQKLLPLVETNTQQERLLFLIALLARDLMFYATGSKQEIAFQMYAPEFKAKLAKISVQAATEACDIVLKKWRLLAINVSFQNVLESLTLELCDCYQR